MKIDRLLLIISLSVSLTSLSVTALIAYLTLTTTNSLNAFMEENQKYTVNWAEEVAVSFRISQYSFEQSLAAYNTATSSADYVWNKLNR